MQPSIRPPGESLPYLEYFPEYGSPPHRIILDYFPFRIGRGGSSQFIIHSRQISKEHAEIFRRGDQILVRDLRSTNGTFVNGERIQEALLSNGDIIHVSHREFKFGHEPASAMGQPLSFQTDSAISPLPESLIRGNAHLKSLIEQESVCIAFQPIVHLNNRKIVGYEALGRGTSDKLSANPAELFRLAHRCGLAPNLSALFRMVAVRDARRLPDEVLIFLNLDPSEIEEEMLFDNLRQVRGAAQAHQQLVLEIHEGAVTDAASMGRLRDHLKELEIRLAYDDFGAGQARLMELVKIPPDFIKLDMSLIRGVDTDTARQDLIQALNNVASNLGVQILAEGIETTQEAEACVSLGCHLGQGYLFGRPQQLGVTHHRSGPAPRR